MRVAQGIVDVDRGLLVVGVRVAGIERGNGRGHGARVEVHFHANLGGRHRLDVGGIDLQRVRRAGQYLAGRADAVAGQLGALGIGHVAVLVERELAVAGVLHHARRHGTEEALAIDGHVERVVRGFDIALGELLGDLRHLGTDTRGHAADAAQRAGVDVRELRGRPLEADGAGVGDVVTDDVEGFGSAVQAAQTLLKRHLVLQIR